MSEVCGNGKSKQEAGPIAKALAMFQYCEVCRRHRQQQQGQTRSLRQCSALCAGRRQVHLRGRLSWSSGL